MRREIWATLLFVRSRLLPFVLCLVILDVAVVFTLGRNGMAMELLGGSSSSTADLTADPSSPPVASSDPAADQQHPMDSDWALCLTRFDGKPVTPTSVAITYLDTGVDEHVSRNGVRSWFGELDGMLIDVYKLEHADGTRRISFELTRSKWPEWQRVVGDNTGETACSLVRAALLAADVERPRPDSDTDSAGSPGAGEQSDSRTPQFTASRHQFEFIYARRPALYRTIEWVGHLDHALELDTFARLHTWLFLEGDH